MLVDLSLSVSGALRKDAAGHEKMVSFGHLGTHFDVMNQEFPLEFTKREALFFDVQGISEITSNDVDLRLVEPGMFVIFYTGYIQREPYGTKAYFQ